MTMRTVRAATIAGPGDNWAVEELELDTTLAPDEVLVRMEAAGLCHSDEHLRTGALPARFPFVGGHEGAGIVEAVGAAVTRAAVGDRVVCTFRPICGTCERCEAGRGNLCVRSAELQSERVYSGFSRDGVPYAATNLIGSFAEYVKCPEFSVVPVGHDVPAPVAALLGCAVSTGIGAVRHAGALRPGERVLVVGAGGVGVSAIHGARVLGAAAIAAVDLSESKLDQAREFGATHTHSSVEEAAQAVGGFDLILLTVGSGPLIARCVDALAPAGRLVLAALGDPERFRLDLPVNLLVRQDITVRGTILGSAHLLTEIPWILEQYRAGRLALDALVSHRFALDEIAEGYAALHSAELLRGVIVHGTA